MKSAVNAANQICILKKQIASTQSPKRRNDLTRKLNRSIKELEEYCGYRKLDFRVFEKMWATL